MRHVQGPMRVFARSCFYYTGIEKAVRVATSLSTEVLVSRMVSTDDSRQEHAAYATATSVQGEDLAKGRQVCDGADSRQESAATKNADLLLAATMDASNSTMQHLSSVKTDNSDFLAGFVYGLQHAHRQALDQVKKTGAVEMRVLICQQEQSRLQDRLGKIEQMLACSVGLLGSTLEYHARRLSNAETSTAAAGLRLDGMMMRVEALEGRTLLAITIRCVRNIGEAIRRFHQAVALLPLRFEQRLCLFFAASWVMIRVLGILGAGRRFSACKESRLLEQARRWSWLLFLVSSQRASRRALGRGLATLASSFCRPS